MLLYILYNEAIQFSSFYVFVVGEWAWYSTLWPADVCVTIQRTHRQVMATPCVDLPYPHNTMRMRKGILVTRVKITYTRFTGSLAKLIMYILKTKFNLL